MIGKRRVKRTAFRRKESGGTGEVERRRGEVGEMEDVSVDEDEDKEGEEAVVLLVEEEKEERTASEKSGSASVKRDCERSFAMRLNSSRQQRESQAGRDLVMLRREGSKASTISKERGRGTLRSEEGGVGGGGKDEVVVDSVEGRFGGVGREITGSDSSANQSM